VFGEWLCDMARADTRSWASRPRCAKARAWCKFSQQFPERYFDVGIAEQHAVTFAAGLASRA
jgi:1-deoxy-D-xylulose-5-phosphate synthase